MAKEQEITVKSLLRFDLIIILIMLFVPLVFFQKHALVTILTAFLVLFSRATSLYDNLKIEVHSTLVLVLAHLFGFWPGAFVVVITAPLVNVAGKLLGSFQKPPWILLDTIYLVILSFVASILLPSQLFYYGFLTIIILGNVILGFIRVYFFMDPITRRIPLGVINIMFNYLILKNFLPQIIAFMR